MKNNLALIFILFLSLLLRLINLNQSLWLDEAINVVYAKSNDFVWFITKYPIGDFHPAGWFVILWGWGNIFGWSEISVRMPSIIFGILTVFFTYLIGKELFSKKIGLISALMLCIAPLHIYYSQEARMYSLSAFAVTFSFYSLTLFLNKRKFGWFAFFVSIILVFYSDYVAYFIFPVQFIYLIIYYKSHLQQYLFAFCAALVFYIPWMLILPQQFFSGQQTAAIIPGWREIVGGSSLRDLILLGIKVLVGRVSINNNILYFIFVLLLATPFLICLTKIREVINKNSILILLWFVFTPVIVWIFSFFIPIFSYFRLIYILPAFYIFIALLLNKFSSKMSISMIILVIISEIISSGLYLFVNDYQRENWKEASLVANGQNNTVVVFEDNEVIAPFIYYNERSRNSFPGLINKPAKSTDDVIDFQLESGNPSKIYLFDYLVGVNDPQKFIEKKLINSGYKKIQQFDYRGVGFVTLYEI